MSIPEGFKLVNQKKEDSKQSNIPKGFKRVGNNTDFIGSGVVEPIKTIGSAIAQTAGGGIAGIAASLNPNLPEGAGADVATRAKDNIFKPTTEKGKKNLETLGSLVEKGIDLVNFPLSGLEGLSKLIAGKGIDDAVLTIKDIQENGLGQNLGNRALEATNSPLAATIAEVLPEATAELIGLKGAGVAARSTPDALSSANNAFSNATRQLIPTADDISRKLTSNINDKDLRRIESGDVNTDVAGKDILEPLNDLTIIQKGLGLDRRRIVKDRPMLKAERQGFDIGVLDFMKKQTGQADIDALQRMTSVAEIKRRDPVTGSTLLPAMIAGNALLDQLNSIKRINRAAGQQIGNASEFLEVNGVSREVPSFQFSDRLRIESDSGVPGNGQRSQLPFFEFGDRFREAIEELRIGIDGDDLDFSKSLVPRGGRRAAIQDIWRRMTLNQNPNAMDLHQLKQYIDESVSYGKQVKGLGGKAESILRELRSGIRDTLNTAFPRYAEANRVYAETIQVIDEIQRLAGKNTDLTGSGAGSQLAALSRRLTSTAQSREQVRSVVERLTTVLDRNDGFGQPLRITDSGGTSNRPNIQLLMKYADELDRVMGNASGTSFTGSIETGIKAARSPSQAIGDAATELAKNKMGINKKKALRSMRQYLRSLSANGN